MANLDWHNGAEVSIGITLLDSAPESEGIDLRAVRAYRLNRTRKLMAQADIAALILSDPVNIRYATGTRNMQVFSSRNTPSRYLLITAERTILYEFTGCHHLAAGFETVDEVRPAKTASFVAAGFAIAERERAWSKEMYETIVSMTESRPVVGIERMNAGVAMALTECGARLVDAQATIEMARAIKSDEEIKCVRASLRATERGVEALRQTIRPGITENELWATLHQSVIAQNGDYIETRLLSAGPRTNPWFQESSSRPIEENELVALDTDVVGCHGYYADFSRTFHVGPSAPSKQQIELYRTAYEQVHHNMALLSPGVSFREYADRAWEIPQRYFANRYYLSAHGVGMTGEYPYLYHRADYNSAGYDGELKPGMTICVESYIGEEGGEEGVKLEQQLLITDSGTELLSTFPFEDDLLR